MPQVGVLQTMMTESVALQLLTSLALLANSNCSLQICTLLCCYGDRFLRYDIESRLDMSLYPGRALHLCPTQPFPRLLRVIIGSFKENCTIRRLF